MVKGMNSQLMRTFYNAGYLDPRENQTGKAANSENRLTITPDTDYTSLTEDKKELWHRASEGCAMLSSAARDIYCADNAKGVDLDSTRGKIHIQTVQNMTLVEEQLVIKDPGNRQFDLKNIQSFDFVASDRFSGNFMKMSLKNDVELDTDGDGKKEKGMLCTLQDGVAKRYTSRFQVNSDIQVFFDEKGKSITIMEAARERDFPF